MTTIAAQLNQRDGNGESALHRAVRDNDLNEVKCLLAAGANVNVRSHGRIHHTPLHLAAKIRNAEIANVLLDYNAELEAKDESTYGFVLFVQLNQFLFLSVVGLLCIIAHILAQT